MAKYLRAYSWFCRRLCPTALMLFFLTIPVGAQEPGPTTDLVIVSAGKEHHFSIELAATPEDRAVGLMYRKKLDPASGMLFVYPKKQRISMWMKNTYVSLDMLFIDRDGTILHMAEYTTPLSTAVISSRMRVMAVLEVPAGTVGRLAVDVGDKIRHPVFDED